MLPKGGVWGVFMVKCACCLGEPKLGGWATSGDATRAVCRFYITAYPMGPTRVAIRDDLAFNALASPPELCSAAAQSPFLSYWERKGALSGGKVRATKPLGVS